MTDIESDKSFYLAQPGIIFREDGEKILVDENMLDSSNVSFDTQILDYAEDEVLNEERKEEELLNTPSIPL